METSRENCASDLGRVKWLVKEDWKGRTLGNFAKELGEFYVSQGQLEDSALDKFTTNVDNTFVKAYQEG